MKNHSNESLVDAQAAAINSQEVGCDEPTKYDEMVTDILKHLTTLNTGLLAIIAAFNQEIIPVFRLNGVYTTYFLVTFYMSLSLCMFGFMTTIFVLRKKESENWAVAYRAREIMVFIAAIGYICALMILLALFTSAYQVPV